MAKTKCTEQAKITLPWGGKLLNYCPFHANELAILAKVMGVPLQAQRLPLTSFRECESLNELTEAEKETNQQFKL